MPTYPTMAGIYGIRCLANNRRYVGSSQNLRIRIEDHKRSLRRGDHKNDRLQRSWNKHGEESFLFIVLELVPDFENLVDREQWWVNLFDSMNRETGFNIKFPGDTCAGCTQSEESNLKRSIAHRGRKKSPEHIAKSAAQGEAKRRALKPGQECPLPTGVAGVPKRRRPRSRRHITL